MGLSTHHNAGNNKYGTLSLRRHLTVAHAHVQNGWENTQNRVWLYRGAAVHICIYSVWRRLLQHVVTLRRAALLGRHMTVRQDTVLRELQSGQHILRCPASIWQLNGHSDHNAFCFTEGKTLTRAFPSCS